MTKGNTKKIVGTDEAWDSRELGADIEHAVLASDADMKAVNEAFNLQPISIRLPKTVIDDFKTIAQVSGVRYQSLMKEALARFADCEMKRLAREYADVIKKQAESESQKKVA
jgi:predicted DNA binding CopG/RHH family protein